jgi:hypothetical protein
MRAWDHHVRHHNVKWRCEMKKVLTVLAVATAVASATAVALPAFAAASTSHRQAASARTHARHPDSYRARAQGVPQDPSPYYAPAYRDNEYWHDRAKGSPG